MPATDSTVEETPKHFLKDLVKPRRKFNIAAITAYVKVKKTEQHEQNPADPVTCHALQRVQVPMLFFAVQGADGRWVMVKFRGAPRVHLSPGDSETPLRRRRRESVGKPLARLEGSGTGIAYVLESDELGNRLCLCDLCARAPGSGTHGHQLITWTCAAARPWGKKRVDCRECIPCTTVLIAFHTCSRSSSCSNPQHPPYQLVMAEATDPTTLKILRRTRREMQP